MMKKEKNLDPKRCIHCGRCTKNCIFLDKYHIDIGNTDRLAALAYHCFLCGRCSQVCPEGIDGRQIILNMRRNQVKENQGKVPEKGYGMLLWEKQDYRFRNYRHPGKTVLFPGCNFPSFYPQTTRYLAGLLKEQAGIETVFDCCGKPVAELGLAHQETAMAKRLNQRFRQNGIEEVVMVCPNCYGFLEDKLAVKKVSIYEKLTELGLGQMVEEDVQIFPPCPDRQEKRWLKWMEPYLAGKVELIEDVQCCGLGGCGGVREPELAKAMPQELRKYQHIYTYCGTCAGQLSCSGCQETTHMLTEILKVDEWPDTKKSLINRMKTKFW